MKKYFGEGYYCASPEELETIRRDRNRQIFEILRDSYPNGLNAHQLEEKTRVPIKTVYSCLQALEDKWFIRSLGKQHNKPGRPSIKDSESERYRISWIYEDMSRIYDHIGDDVLLDNYILAPGNSSYSNEFLDAWHQIVDKKDEEEICTTLLQFLKKSFRLINEHQTPEIREWSPKISAPIKNNSEKKTKRSEENEDFCCLGCGINHEARDFLRAMLLHLINNLEKNDEFIKFMIDNHLINIERYRQMVTRKAKKFKEKDMKIDI